MTRTAWFLGCGGCLLGWEPDLEPADTGAAPTDTDTDTGALPEGSCVPYDQRDVQVGTSLTPEITSDAGMSDLYVYLGPELQWHAWSTDYQNSVYSFTYGVTGPAITDGGPPVSLVAGELYDLQIDAPCFDEQGDDVLSSVWTTFTAEP